MADNDIASGLRDKYFGRGKPSKAAPSGPEFRAREEKFPLLGATGRALKSVDEFARKPFGYSNPPAEIISDLMQIPALTRTIENINYGSPLTRGTGQARQLTKDTKGAAEALLNLAPGAGPLVRASKGMPIGMIIRPKGSQTIETGLKSDLAGMMRRQNPEAVLAELEQTASRGFSEEASRGIFERSIDEMKKEVALKKWIEGPLAKYIKRDMGTPEDPVRLLAEEGITHTEFAPYFAQPTADLRRLREMEGYPKYGVAGRPEAQRYEAMADFALDEPYVVGRPETAEAFNLGGQQVPEWMQKLPEGTKVFAPRTRNMGFEHIIDVLKEDLATGRIRPDQLSKVSMEQAVRRTHEYNIEKAAAMEKAAVEETGKHFPMHREYESGFRWVNLRAKPAATPDELTPNARSKYDQYMKANVGEDVALERANDYHVEELTEKALKNEGEIMGHCVGSYCEDVLSGVTDIYSLRDPKGRSHVTVEVAHRTADDYYDAAESALRMERGDAEIPSEDIYQRAEEIAKAQGSAGKIEQIKGKQNLAPIEEYQPYVADFVRSGQYAPEIGDFHYTDMVRIGDKLIRRPELSELLKTQNYEFGATTGADPGQYFGLMNRMDPSGLFEADQQMLEAIRNFEPPGMAEGGSVDLRTRYFGPARPQSSKPDMDDLVSRASTDFSTLLAGTMNPVNSDYERPTLPELQPTRFNTLPPIEMI